MSRSATASTPKNPPQLPSKSAWARGPPQQNSANSTPRSQSPALPTPVSSANPSFHANHSRRPSALGQGVSIKDGVSIPRNAVKQDDAPAPISSSPASAPAVKPVEGVKSFGSVAVQNGGSDTAAKSAVTSRPAPLSAPSTSSSSQSQQPAAPPASTPSPVPKFDKKSIAKLFQGPSTQSVPPPAETASPAARSASLPSQAPQQGQPYVPPFTPGGALRQGQNGNPSAPRSPVYSRPMANGQNNSVGVSGRPQAGSGGPSAGPAPAALPSPRMTPHPPPPGPPSGLPPPPAAMWPGYYYHPSFVPGGVPPDQFYPQPQWPGHLIPPQHQPPPPAHPPGPAPPSTSLPMSPRNLPLQQVPGTPTQSHAIPPILHPPHLSAPHPPPPVTSSPPTPSVANRSSTSLSANAGAFVPGKKISIKNASGQEVNLDALTRAPPPIVPPVPPSPVSVKKDIKRPPVRIESQEQKEKRLAEERAKEGESDERSKPSEALIRANEDVARREAEEQERRKAAERKAKEEAERAEKERKEAEERAARQEKERKEAEERAAREEEKRREAEEHAARAREREELEKERLEGEARAQREREAREKAEQERAEQERILKLQQEEARAKQEEEEAERQRKVEEEASKVVEASENAHVLVDDAEPASLPEEGEVEDDLSRPATGTPDEELTSTSKSTPTPPPPPPQIPVELPAKPLEKEPLRIDTILPSPEHQRKRPGPLNLQTTINTNVPPPLPSALATARHIEDINRITYPRVLRAPNLSSMLTPRRADSGMTEIFYCSL
ncbi:hypothetical protein BJV74DRAFT_42192 [Russula compacta]|nr:hypothetical protein BJV74DRAFT_42192 [Russula compacta]